MPEKNLILNLPDWYLTEKEAYKTIQRLTDMKDLTFYLENPDPFIRRLAILRTGLLKKKDSYTLLNNILDDHLEIEENRELAALLMAKLNNELHLGFFISHPYLAHFTGNEDLESLLNITIADPFPDIHMDFKNSLIESRLNLDNEFIKSNLDEKDELLPFSMKDWFNHFYRGFFHDLKKVLKHLTIIAITGLFVKIPKKLFSLIASIPKNIGKHKESSRTQAEPQIETPAVSGGDVIFPDSIAPAAIASRSRRTGRSRRRARVYREPLGLRLKQAFHGFLRLLFSPFRFVFRYKWVILFTLAALYCIFSFTQPGKSFLFRINPHVYYLNTNFLDKAQVSMLGYIKSNEHLASIYEAVSGVPVGQDEMSETDPSQPEAQKLTVTAPKGLYMRSEPVSTGRKLMLMEQNTVVDFAGEEKKDSSGVVWFRVKLDKTVGWANSDWLREVENER